MAQSSKRNEDMARRWARAGAALDSLSPKLMRQMLFLIETAIASISKKRKK